MASGWLILADDLTGAADCAIAFGRRGLPAAVTWGEFADIAGERPTVLAYDAASRGLSATDAAARHAEVLARLSEPGRILFKKIDSTLRGQPAAETAATLAHFKAKTRAAFGVFAPAFPATSRTTIDGCVRVDGGRLEDTETWRREHTYPSADLVAVLATAGIRGVKVPLADIRGGNLKATFAKLADEGDVIAVCDAETDRDLHLIAAASLPASPATFFIGSAGLAHALAHVLADLDNGRPVPPLEIPRRSSGILTVVGSLATASRSAARALAATGTVAHVPVAPQALLSGDPSGTAIATDIKRRLESGGDVLVEIIADDHPDMQLGPQLAERLAALLADVAPAVGAIAATGGETAAALLSGFGVSGIRLSDEIEPGVSLGLTLGRLSVPIATKAGAFGDEHSLIRIIERLRAIRTKGTFT